MKKLMFSLFAIVSLCITSFAQTPAEAASTQCAICGDPVMDPASEKPIIVETWVVGIDVKTDYTFVSDGKYFYAVKGGSYQKIITGIEEMASMKPVMVLSPFLEGNQLETRAGVKYLILGFKDTKDNRVHKASYDFVESAVGSISLN